MSETRIGNRNEWFIRSLADAHQAVFVHLIRFVRYPAPEHHDRIHVPVFGQGLQGVQVKVQRKGCGQTYVHWVPVARSGRGQDGLEPFPGPFLKGGHCEAPSLRRIGSRYHRPPGPGDEDDPAFSLPRQVVHGHDEIHHLLEIAHVQDAVLLEQGLPQFFVPGEGTRVGSGSPLTGRGPSHLPHDQGLATGNGLHCPGQGSSVSHPFGVGADQPDVRLPSHPLEQFGKVHVTPVSVADRVTEEELAWLEGLHEQVTQGAALGYEAHASGFPGHLREEGESGTRRVNPHAVRTQEAKTSLPRDLL